MTMTMMIMLMFTYFNAMADNRNILLAYFNGLGED